MLGNKIHRRKKKRTVWTIAPVEQWRLKGGSLSLNR